MKKLYKINFSLVPVGIATWYWLEQFFGYSTKIWETGIRKKVEKKTPGMGWREIPWVKKSEKRSLICYYYFYSFD